MFAVMKGNPVDGFDVIGPYNSRESAIEHGDTVASDWWVVEVEPPDRWPSGLAYAVSTAYAAADGFSNDDEIEALQAALDEALSVLGVSGEVLTGEVDQ